MWAGSFLVILLAATPTATAGVAYSLSATRVHGQNNSFTTSTTFSPVSNQWYMNNPNSVHVAAATGVVYTSESPFGNRVLAFPGGGGVTVPVAVYGQMGSYTTTSSIVPVNASSLSDPNGIAAHPTQPGAILVADNGNNRCVFYTSGAGATNAATVVYGQPDFVSTGFNRGLPSASAVSLGSPHDVAYDSTTTPPGVWIADSNNHRVLYYALGSTTATRVYGQLGSFVTRVSNNGGVTASSMNFPTALAHAPNVGPPGGTLVVADQSNARVLVFTGTSTVAVRIITGLAGSPQGVAISPTTGGIFVSEFNFNRVLYFGQADAADVVFGQRGSFVTTTYSAPPSRESLANPRGLALDPVTEDLYVADWGVSRVVMFPAVQTNVAVAANQTTTVQGVVEIAQNATLTLNEGSTLTVLGNVTIDGTLLVSAAVGTTFNVSGALTLNQMSNVTVVVPATVTVPVTAGTTLTVLVVENYAQLYGTFSTVQVDASRVPCAVVTAGSVVPVYGASSFSVAFALENACGGSGASTTPAAPSTAVATAVAVAIGCTALAVATVILLVFFMRRHRKSRDAVANAKLRDNDLKRLAATTTAF